MKRKNKEMLQILRVRKEVVGSIIISRSMVMHWCFTESDFGAHPAIVKFTPGGGFSNATTPVQRT